MKPQFMLCPEGQDRLEIVHIPTCSGVGYARFRDGNYHIQGACCEKVGVVRSINDVIPTLRDYYAKHPAQWEGDSAEGYQKFAINGYARVERHKLGHWIVFRNDGHQLLQHGKPAIFATAEDARKAADAYFCNDLPPTEKIEDGYTWEHDPLLEAWSEL